MIVDCRWWCVAGGALALALAACGDDGGASTESTGAGPGAGPGATSAAETTGGTGGTGATMGATGATGASAGTTTDGSTSVVSTSLATEPLFDVGDPDMPVELECSGDLHDVIDGQGEVVESCAPDLGCLDGACVPACEAAAASEANFGCEFRPPTPPSYPYALPPCFAVFMANAWGHPAQLEVWRDGQALDIAGFARLVTPGLDPEDWPPLPDAGLPGGAVGVLFLSSDPNAIMPENQVPLTCPTTPAVDASTQVDGTGRSAAFEITSDIPLTAYDILPFGGARSHFPSAELLFPTSVWGDNYVTVVPPKGTHNVPGPLWMQIVGLEDGTSVDVLSGAQIVAGGGLQGANANEPAAYTVDAGEYLQLEFAAGAGDGSGTIVKSDKPVAVHTGNRFLRLQPMTQPGGEATHQQLSAVTALGVEYVAAPYETRRADLEPEEVDYRAVGVVDGTQLTYDPAIPGAPATLDQGEVVDFATALPFTVASQGDGNPFSLTQLMDTANVPGGTRPGATAPGFPPMLGDEEWVVVLPPGQFMNRYVFFTD
ncbi:MAG: IgGFc-binding protein, partial [Myxococcales bacterium]|nr:IgGFc-binding protein [Myxococcales bacterium]